MEFRNQQVAGSIPAGGSMFSITYHPLSILSHPSRLCDDNVEIGALQLRQTEVGDSLDRVPQTVALSRLASRGVV
jgi:hypothetical protein